MACKSASIERAEEQTANALKVINQLRDKIENLAREEEEQFIQRVKEDLKEYQYNDFLEANKNIATKVDFSREFSIDNLTSAITNIIKGAIKLANPNQAVIQILTNAENITIYTDLVNSIAESIKNSTKGGANTSYSKNKLAPGVFSFINSKSMSLINKETFGNEAVTATTFNYVIYYSAIDAQANLMRTSQVDFLIKSINKLNEARLGLLDLWISDQITQEEYDKKLEAYKKQIADLQRKIVEYQNSQIKQFSHSNIKSKTLDSLNLEHALPAIISESLEEDNEALYSKQAVQSILNKATDALGPDSATELDELKAIFNVSDY